MKSRYQSLFIALLGAVLTAGSAPAAVEYSNGFEVDTTDWSGVTRVATGTGGVASADGSFHGIAASGAFTRWGGYNFGAGNAVPTVFQEYWTSVDINLDVDGPFANDTRFDFTSAINNNLGTHLRDFAFNVGFYDDATGPGAGTDRFVVSAGNNTGRANSFPKNTGAIAISTTGWYTFEHHFFDNGGVLGVTMSIFDSANALVNSWNLGSDPIAGVGGNRYGWFPSNEFVGGLPIDNAEMRTADAGVVPEPYAIAVWSVLGLCGSAIAWRSSRRVAG